MNNRRFTFPIAGLLFVGVLVAIVVPSLIFLAISIDSSNRVNQRNLEAFIFENGLRRKESIEQSFNATVELVNSFIGDNVNRSVLSTTLRISGLENSPTIIEQVSTRTVSLLQTSLLNNPEHYLEGAWLLSLEGAVISSAVAPNSRLPFILELANEQNSDSYRLAQNLLNTEEPIALAVASRNGANNLEIVTVVRDTTEAIVGFLILDLDLNRIIFDNLGANTPDYDVYSFFVMPDGLSSLQLTDVRRRSLVSLDTIGVERALGGTVDSVDIYIVDGAITQEVIGFYSAVNVLNTRFAFVNELNANILNEQRLEYFQQVGLPILIAIVFLLGTLVLLLLQFLKPPIDQIEQAIVSMKDGDFAYPVDTDLQTTELADLSVQFIDMRGQTERLIKDMRLRIEERTRDVRLTQRISRVVLAERDLNILLNRVVNLITENFSNIYHAQIFLVDETNEFAILKASTGQAGQELLKRGHRLAVGSVSVIGQVTDQGQFLVVRDNRASDVHRPNELLADTRSELAIPMISNLRVIGVLDVQSKEPNSFSDDQVSALNTLTEQITIAIENARLYEQSQQLISNLEVEKRNRTRRAWQDYFNAQRASSLVSHAGMLTPDEHHSLRQAVLRNGQSIIGEKTDRNTIPFAVPIRLRDQILGVIECESRVSEFNYDKVLLAEELANRLALSLDNARLFQGSVQAVERERIVNEISAKLTSQTDVQDIIDTAIREVSEALRTPNIAVRFQLDNTASPPSSNGGISPSKPKQKTATLPTIESVKGE
jgi:GAF domain-containing protein